MSARPHIQQPAPDRRRTPDCSPAELQASIDAHRETRDLIAHVEQPRLNRVPRAHPLLAPQPPAPPAPPPGGTVISLHAYRRHSAIVAGVIVSAGAMFAAWWFGS
jgi:hypothetical protein